MIPLLIITDDFTGALDTGVQFAAEGIKTKIMTGHRFPSDDIKDKIQVLVVNAETRHLKPEQAYQIVYEIIHKAKIFGVSYIFKKTDSALRGNIGSELTAVLAASRESELHFIPAFPCMDRVTKKGIHYIGKVPVAQSVFGKDPFEPVRDSCIADLIHKQSNVAVQAVSGDCPENGRSSQTIKVYDAETDSEILRLAEGLERQGRLHLMAGCAGLASVLPDVLKLKGEKAPESMWETNLLVICGSVNPVTAAQIDAAEQAGFTRISLRDEEKSKEDYFRLKAGRERLKQITGICAEKRLVIVDSGTWPEETERSGEEMEKASNEEMRKRISGILGFLGKSVLDSGYRGAVLITGGDTLIGFIRECKIREVEPVCELEPGVVLSKIWFGQKVYPLITKSGGFGEKELLISLADKMVRKQEEKYELLRELLYQRTTASREK